MFIYLYTKKMQKEKNKKILEKLENILKKNE